MMLMMMVFLTFMLITFLPSCHHEQGRSITQAVSATVLINSRYVVTVCLIFVTVKTNKNKRGRKREINVSVYPAAPFRDKVEV